MAQDVSNNFDVMRGQAVAVDQGDGFADTEGPTLVKKLRLRPLVDRVLVRVLIPEEELVNGLVIPDSAKEKPQEGLVLAVGNGQIKNGERLPVDVRVGQRVLFGKYSGNEVKLDNEILLLLREDEIMGCFE